MDYGQTIIILFFITLLSSTILPQTSEKDVDQRRPFYLMAHMKQTTGEVDAAFAEGANCVESDLRFTKDGIPGKLYHGFPCDCFRYCDSSQDFVPYLRHIRRFGIPGDPLYNASKALVYLDTKLHDVDSEHLNNAGIQVANMLIEHFFQNGSVVPKLKMVIGVPSVQQKEFFHGLFETFETQKDLLQNIGFDFSDNEDIILIEEAVKNLSLTNVWLGRGVTNCLPQTDSSLREAIQERDNENGSYIAKIYAWTIDCAYRMRSDLRLNSDGIITNKVGRMLDVLEEFSEVYRLATNEDDPWNNIRGNGALSSKCFLGKCWQDCNPAGSGMCLTEAPSCNGNESICESHANCVMFCIPTSITLICP